MVKNKIIANGELVDVFSNISFQTDKIPDYINNIHIPFFESAKVTFEYEIGGDLFAGLLGFDEATGMNFTMEFNTPITVQVKRHRRKRINKKWAKRYGYKIVFKRSRLVDCTIKQDHCIGLDGHIMFESRGLYDG